MNATDTVRAAVRARLTARLTEPVNAQVAETLRSAPELVPAVWMALRSRWEYGHAAGFAVQLVGVCALIHSVVLETPEDVRAR